MNAILKMPVKIKGLLKRVKGELSLCRILGHSSVEVTQNAYLDFSDEEIGKISTT
ncbi:hypothetical protein D3C71_1907120 [compost metagenome]